MTIEKAWIRLPERAIVFPPSRMKSRRDFALPLSAHMVALVERALSISEALYPGSAWLFPTRTADGSAVIATRVVRESERGAAKLKVGHVLRHSHATFAKACGVDDISAALLSDHAVAGVRGIYTHNTALFEQLLAAQERISQHILALNGTAKTGENH